MSKSAHPCLSGLTQRYYPPYRMERRRDRKKSAVAIPVAGEDASGSKRNLLLLMILNALMGCGREPE